MLKRENQLYFLPETCDFYYLKDTCTSSRISSLFDNPMTVVFAVIMSIWAALFLELWKRYSAEISHRWGLCGFDIHEEYPRPKYLTWLKKKQEILKSEANENRNRWRIKLPRVIVDVSLILTFILVAFAAAFGILIYNKSIEASLLLNKTDLASHLANHATKATAAFINFVAILILNDVYEWLAVRLTDMEHLRTQTEYDDSFTLKTYLLQFINTYASLFYIAFLKGTLLGESFKKFFNLKKDECSPGGCFLDLIEQMATIMILKQCFNLLSAYLWPRLKRYFKSVKISKEMKRDEFLMRICSDMKLMEFTAANLSANYRAMIFQYGFVTFFTAACPFAPFFALIYNIIKIRLDARNLLAYYRRPAFARVQNIGVCYDILDTISKFAIATNGLIIAFTSEFIPKMIYRFYYSEDKSLDGYMDFMLSTFNTSDFDAGAAPLNIAREFQNITTCRFQGYRYKSMEEESFEKSSLFWQILAARLVFAMIFEHTVAIGVTFFRYLIPDMSKKLSAKIRFEKHIISKIIYEKESNDDTKLPLNKLYQMKLSSSDLDIFIHSQNEKNNEKRLANVD